jgi:hypothetical protein
MTSMTVETVAIQTIQQYADAGLQINAAIREVGRRAASRLSKSYAENLARALPFLSETARDGLTASNDRLIGLVVDRLVGDSERAALESQRTADLSKAGVRGLADLIKVAAPSQDAQTDEAATALALHGAYASLAVATVVKDAAGALAKRIVEDDAENAAAADEAVAVVTPKRAAKSARR